MQPKNGPISAHELVCSQFYSPPPSKNTCGKCPIQQQCHSKPAEWSEQGLIAHVASQRAAAVAFLRVWN